MGDDDREAILARRRKFIAGALMGTGAAAAAIGTLALSMPCLSPVPEPGSPDAGAPLLVPGLTPMGAAEDAGIPDEELLDDPDAGADAGADAGTDAGRRRARTAPSDEGRARPCLSSIPSR